MKIFECKCGSTDVFTEQSGNNTGLYCGDCGKWIKWLNKDELRLANRQIENQNAKVKADAIEECIQSIKNRWIMWDIGVINAVIEQLENLKEQK